jgi:hypothetical protein
MRLLAQVFDLPQLTPQVT